MRKILFFITCLALLGVTTKVKAQYKIPKTNASPTIDGYEDAAWDNQPEYIIAEVTGEVSSFDDLSSTFKVLWDDTNIYFFFKVKDEVVENLGPKGVDGETPWYIGDNIEIGFQWGGQTVWLYRFFPELDNQLGLQDGGIEQVVGNHTNWSLITQTGYTIEAVIPWSDISNLTTPLLLDSNLDLVLKTNDVDNPNADVNDWDATEGSISLEETFTLEEWVLISTPPKVSENPERIDYETMKLYWEKPIAGAHGYQLERKIGSNAYEPLVTTSRTRDNNVYYDYTLLPGESSYSYRIRAFKNEQPSEWVEFPEARPSISNQSSVTINLLKENGESILEASAIVYWQSNNRDTIIVDRQTLDSGRFHFSLYNYNSYTFKIEPLGLDSSYYPFFYTNKLFLSKADWVYISEDTELNMVCPSVIDYVDESVVIRGVLVQLDSFGISSPLSYTSMVFIDKETLEVQAHITTNEDGSFEALVNANREYQVFIDIDPSVETERYISGSIVVLETNVEATFRLANNKIETSIETVSGLTDIIGVEVYPNPTTGQLYIKNASGEEIYYTTHSVIGNKLEEGTLTANERAVIDLSQSGSQVVIVQITNGETQQTERVIINKK